MGEIDWESVGLMAGLEIHQQLGFSGSKKLFCGCPAEITEEEPDLIIRRKLRASAGETGTIDVAALAEQKKAKTFTYHAFKSCCCLVELDEEPPHSVDKDSIKTALMVANKLNSNVLSTAQFMRKTIVDGSNVSGFQRTGLVAIGGKIPGLDFDVGIQTVAVEEDAAKIISRTSKEDTYNLSRLGIPLIEIATDPDMKTPEQVHQTASQLGMILRSTKRVKRGLGTIRQDVNVSVIGGTRVEIKGCQDLRMMAKIVENEAIRQINLIKLKDENRTLTTGDLLEVREFEDSDKVFVKNALKSGTAVGVCVNDAQGLFGRELSPGLRIGKDLADLAKTKGFGGIIHSDEDISKYGLESNEPIREALGCEPEDGFIVVLGKQEEAESLIRETILPRLSQLFQGVPKEVRKANDDGTTSYLRPMPGGARMYPETDIPLVRLSPDSVPDFQLLTEQFETVAKETGLSLDLARTIVMEDVPIKEYKEKFPSLEYSFLSSALIEWPREIEKKLSVNFDNPEKYVLPLLKEVESGKIAGSSVKSALEKIGEYVKKGEEFPLDKVSELVQEQLPEDDLRKIVKEVISANPGLSTGAYMGDIMKKARGKADGKTVMKLLQEEIK